MSGAWNFALRSRSIIGHFLHHTWPEHSYTPLDASKPQTYILFIYMLSDTSSRYLRTNQDNNRHHQTPTDTKRHQQTSPDTQKGRSRIVLTWNGVCWCLLVSYVVWRCEEGVWGVFSKRIWVLFMDVCTVSLRLRVYMSVLALYGAENAIYWKSFERQNSMHLTLLKHQNTKTSLYKLSKNGWVCAFF